MVKNGRKKKTNFTDKANNLPKPIAAGKKSPKSPLTNGQAAAAGQRRCFVFGVGYSGARICEKLLEQGTTFIPRCFFCLSFTCVPRGPLQPLTLAQTPLH